MTVENGHADLRRNVAEVNHPVLERWLPRRLVEHAQELPCEMFIHQYGSPFYLVVVLDVPDGELAAGLAENSARDAIPFRTSLRTHEEEPTGLHAQREPSATALKRPSEVTALRLRNMADQHCFVVPLCKSSKGAFLNFISVGRARNHDVVLRHPTVSKFHATLELSEGLFLKDAGSQNHTLLNFQRILDRVPVQSGDHVRFGLVEALVCTAGALWHAARRGV